MWLLEAWAPVPGFYNEAFRHRFPSTADAGMVAEALSVLTRRHEVLRTSFPSLGGQPYQSIAPPSEVQVQVPVTDLRHLAPGARQDELRRLEAVETDAPFDVAAGPIFRTRLFLVDDGHSELCVVLDHLVADATSEAILASELDEVHSALVAGRQPVLRRQEIDYADFAVWQRRWMDDQRLQAHLGYWRGVLRGVSPMRRLPYRTETRDPSAPGRSDLTLPPAMIVATIPAAVSDALRRLPRSSGFVVCTAAVAALVARSTGDPDILVVTSVGGRDRAALDGVVGLFGGPSVLRIDLSGDPVFEVVLRRARASVLGVLEHQHLPFSRVGKALEDDGISLSLATIPVAVHFFRAAARRWAPGTSVVQQPPSQDGPAEIGFREASKPLEFRFYDDGATLWFELLYHPDLYDAGAAGRVMADLSSLLAAVAADPLLRLSQLPHTCAAGSG